MASVKDLEAQLAQAREDEAKTVDKPRRTLGDILHDLANVTGRHYLHDDIDALGNSGDKEDTVPDPNSVKGADDTSIEKGEYDVRTTPVSGEGNDA
jgi:hypothetical protein